jgi:hypothetical protein
MTAPENSTPDPPLTRIPGLPVVAITRRDHRASLARADLFPDGRIFAPQWHDVAHVRNK